jgi:hypothetical protein
MNDLSKKEGNRILELSGVLSEANIGQIQAAGQVASKKMGGAGKVWDKAYNKQTDKAGDKSQLIHYSQIYGFIQNIMKNPNVKPAEVISTLKKIIQDVAKNVQQPQ